MKFIMKLFFKQASNLYIFLFYMIKKILLSDNLIEIEFLYTFFVVETLKLFKIKCFLQYFK